jgi:hypothetical protein
MLLRICVLQIQVESRASPRKEGSLFRISTQASWAASRASSGSLSMRRQIEETKGP